MPPSAGEGFTWRRDLDGLRGLAILAVLAFHFFPAWVQGGFVGVDIFFVVSGYLITGILLSGLAAGRWSLGDFYLRRVRRLFPALAVVLAAVLALGSAVLYSDEYRALGNQTVAGAAFFANLQLWRQSGYFDAAIESKPLAHLWSLGVEEQFYLLWPLALWGLHRRRFGGAVLALLVAASFAACVLMVGRNASAAFYLPVFRFWEPLAGAALAMAQARWRWRLPAPDAVSGTGLALLAAGVALIHPGLPFPGWWTLLPVGGTALLILAGPQALGNRRLLGNRLMVGLGLISFPLYLWHWPLLTLARLTFNAEPGPMGMCVLLALSLLLAWLTYAGVEAPIRAAHQLRRNATALAAAVTAIACAAAVSPAFLVRHPPLRVLPLKPSHFFDGNPLLVDGCGLTRATEPAIARCARDARGPERFALVGDSKAEALFPGLVRTSQPAGRWLFIGGSSQHGSVVPVVSEAPAYRAGQEQARVALESLARNPRIETVVVATAIRALFQIRREDSIEDLPASPRGPQAQEGLQRFVSEVLRSGKKVVLLVDNPTLPDPRRCLSSARWIPPQPLADWFSALAPDSRCQVSLARHRQLSAKYLHLLREVQRLAPDRIFLFDTAPFLCDRVSGMCGPTEGAVPRYSYTDHISGQAADTIGRALNAALVQGAWPPGGGAADLP